MTVSALTRVVLFAAVPSSGQPVVMEEKKGGGMLKENVQVAGIFQEQRAWLRW